MIQVSSEKQRTLKVPFQFSGTGLHSGCSVTASVKPAPAGTGIAFRRTDQGDAPWVKAVIENIQELPGRQTTLGKGENSISTIEHLMSVFYGLGVDNAYVEVDGPEIPGLDGSGDEFCEKVEAAGFETQDANREYFVVEDPVFLEFKDASCVILPASEFKVSYTLSYKNESLSDQFFETLVNEEVFRREIAPARTFVLKQEAMALMAKGYGKGADCTNTLVFENDQPLKNTLRFKDEAARHKTLDMLGDLYLLGYRLKGHVISSRTGHMHNLKTVQALKERLLKSSVSVSNEHLTAKELDINMIKRLLPHRYPFLFVDRVTIVEEAKRVIGIKNVTVNDYFFQGHFPGRPIMPGVLIVEAMAQTGGIALLRRAENYGKLAYFMSLNDIKFRQPVVPGDQLKLDVTIVKAKTKIAECSGKAYVGDKLVCEAVMRVAIVDKV